jgi:hypothetical protein
MKIAEHGKITVSTVLFIPHSAFQNPQLSYPFNAITGSSSAAFFAG